MPQAKALTKHQINKVLTTCLLMQSPEMKRAVVVLSHSTLRVTELARLTIGDLLLPSGQIKTEITLRSKTTKGKKPRTVWLSRQTVEVLQAWLDYRKSKRWALSHDDKYQGFIAASAVIFNNRGRAYALKCKHRTKASGAAVEYWACDSLEYLFRDIYKRCGLKGASSHSGRRSYATNMNRRGIELGVISKALGHADEGVTLDYIDVSSVQLIKAFELAF